VLTKALHWKLSDLPYRIRGRVTARCDGDPA